MWKAWEFTDGIEEAMFKIFFHHSIRWAMNINDNDLKQNELKLSIKLWKVNENNRKSEIFGFSFCMVKYSQISEFTWVS